MTLLKIMCVLRGKNNLKIINLVYPLHLKKKYEVSFPKTTTLAEPEYSVLQKASCLMAFWKCVTLISECFINI